MKAVIYLDVPEWQIGKDVTIYFPDTMEKHGKCELLKEQRKAEVVYKPYNGWNEAECSNCGQHLDKAYSYCPKCKKELDWNSNQT